MLQSVVASVAVTFLGVAVANLVVAVAVVTCFIGVVVGVADVFRLRSENNLTADLQSASIRTTTVAGTSDVIGLRSDRK